MKNIFKKNQIIITALAIMIAIAGYLSFTNNDKPHDNGTIQTANPDLEELDVISEVDGSDLAQADTDDTATDDTTTDDNAATDDNNADTTAADDNDETTDVESDELGDISDDDMLEAANDVTDTGELDLEDGVPGEAVLASTTIGADFFISNKIEREQLRSINRETYMQVIESPDVEEALKQDAIANLLELTTIAEKERATEIALGARGFEDALVTINEGNVDVVINAESISDQQLAIIEDVVKSKTEIPVANMTIVPVVMEE